jgi:signal peptidase I
MALTLLTLIMVGVLLVISASSAPAAILVPQSRVSSNDIVLNTSAAQIQIENAKWVTVAGTRSMEPVLMEGAQVLERVPHTPSELYVGDIITFQSYDKNLPIIHRVVDIGSDQYGWYAQTKGDNSKNIDSELVRFSQVTGVVVAIIY